MVWTIKYDARVNKELRKLGRSEAKKILDYFDHKIAPAVDATSFGKPLKLNLAGLWRFRIGDYRAICKIENDEMVVMVIAVGHRSKVYKN